MISSFRYFSSLFAASKNFPDYIGVASGSSMALFGLSPLFLSLIASRFFTDPIAGLNVTQFLTFHAVAAGLVHLLGAFNLHTPSVSTRLSSMSEESSSSADSDLEESLEPTERTPFLPGKQKNVDVQVIPVDEEASIADLLRDTQFWLLAVIIMFTLGSVSLFTTSLKALIYLYLV